MPLIGVTELSLAGRGPKRAFVFDAHRLALPCWAKSVEGTSAVLVTLDRHFDTVPPVKPPQPGMNLAALELHTHRELDIRNYDHVLAAMEARVLSHAIVIARARPVGSVEGPLFVDSRGGQHAIASAPTVDAIASGISADSQRAMALLEEAESVILDIDLDCFTTSSDADPTTPVPWPVELIREHVMPRGSEPFWDLVLRRCVALTFAREPAHCGGLIAANRLFEAAADVIFRQLLETDLP